MHITDTPERGRLAEIDPVVSLDDSAKIARSFDEITESIGNRLLPVLASLALDIPVLLGQMTELERLGHISGLDVGSLELADIAITDLSESTRFFGSILRALPFGPSGGFTEGLREILDESELTNEELDQLIDNVGLLREEGKLTGAQAEVLTGILQDQRKSVEELDQEQRDAANTLALEVIPRTEELRDAVLDGLDPALGDLADTTDDAADAVVNLGDAMLAAADPAFNLIKTTSDAAEAQARLNDTRDEFGVGSSQFLEAANAAAEATGRQNAAQQIFNEEFGPQSEETFRTLLAAAGLYADEIETIIDGIFRAAEATRMLPPVRSGGGGGGGGGGGESRFHTGGRVNAPRGQEVFARVLGGEIISNPAHGGGIGTGPGTEPGSIGDVIGAIVDAALVVTDDARFHELSEVVHEAIAAITKWTEKLLASTAAMVTRNARATQSATDQTKSTEALEDATWDLTDTLDEIERGLPIGGRSGIGGVSPRRGINGGIGGGPGDVTGEIGDIEERIKGSDPVPIDPDGIGVSPIRILPVFVGSEAALGAELDRLLTKRSRSSPLGFS